MKAVKKFSDNGVYYKTVDDAVPEIVNDADMKIRMILLASVRLTFTCYTEL
jgi:hypothetical protein